MLKYPEIVTKVIDNEKYIALTYKLTSDFRIDSLVCVESLLHTICRDYSFTDIDGTVKKMIKMIAASYGAL
jgi:hypothetical protein